MTTLVDSAAGRLKLLPPGEGVVNSLGIADMLSDGAARVPTIPRYRLAKHGGDGLFTPALIPSCQGKGTEQAEGIATDIGQLEFDAITG